MATKNRYIGERTIWIHCERFLSRSLLHQTRGCCGVPLCQVPHRSKSSQLEASWSARFSFGEQVAALVPSILHHKVLVICNGSCLSRGRHGRHGELHKRNLKLANIIRALSSDMVFRLSLQICKWGKVKSMEARKNTMAPITILKVAPRTLITMVNVTDGPTERERQRIIFMTIH